MIQELQKLKEEAIGKLASSGNLQSLEDWRIEYLGRQGKLPALLEGMKSVSKEDRPAVGKFANEVKTTLQSSFDSAKTALEDADIPFGIDPTMPGRPLRRGARHPIVQTMDRMIKILRRMGFALASGPDLEWEYYNFDALNTPAGHPARNEQDTFYANIPPHPQYGRALLRSQTSPVQIRVMEKQKAPIQIISPGRCYRRDEIDATHGVTFHQIEGLLVDKNITLANLKGTLEFFFKELLGNDTKVRFRPHFFPFTEPSYEVDFSKPGLKIRGKEWLEICGCGMVDPNVLQNVKIDPEQFNGFAFGMGVERIAMILHEIPDLRLFFENDLRFLKQFA